MPLWLFMAGKGFSTSKLTEDVYACHLVTGDVPRVWVSSSSDLEQQVKATWEAETLMEEDVFVGIIEKDQRKMRKKHGVLEGLPCGQWI